MAELSEILKKIRLIEIKAKKISEQMLMGDFHSAFKGSGMSFREVREYQVGDDVKHIDWNVTARSGKTHVKLFDEDRESAVILLIDQSPSMFFGSEESDKTNTMAYVSAIIAFSSIQNSNKIGALFTNQHQPSFLKPSKSNKTVFQIIRQIVSSNETKTYSKLNNSVEYLYKILKRRSIVFIISDFLEEGYEQALKMLAKKHEVIGIGIYDSAEKTFSPRGLFRVKDLETGKMTLIDASSPKFRSWQTENFRQIVEKTTQIFGDATSDFISIFSQENYVRKLVLFFKKRSFKYKR